VGTIAGYSLYSIMNSNVYPSPTPTSPALDSIPTPTLNNVYPTITPTPTPTLTPTPTPIHAYPTSPTPTPTPTLNNVYPTITPTPTPTLTPTPTPIHAYPTSPPPTPAPTLNHIYPTPTPIHAYPTSPPPTPTPTLNHVYPTTIPTPMLTPTPTPIKTSLSNAIALGYVQASITGNGASSGDSIILNIKRLVTYTVEIDPLSLGTVLTTSETAQSMVINKLEGIENGDNTYTPTNRILLVTSNQVAYLFNAYCLTFHRSNPESSNLFTASGMASANVVKILNVLPSLAPSITTVSAVQTAIWTVTDNIGLNDLSTTFPSGVNQIGNAKTILIAAGIDTAGKQLFT
jgi:hypothetical protein